MKTLNCIIIGSGKRVRETALPAMLRAGKCWNVRGVYARKEKELNISGSVFSVKSLERAVAADFTDIDIVYMAVGKQAVGPVARRLHELGLSRAKLLIDTPVLLIKHFRHLPLLQQFAQAHVAEDCIALPWYDLAAQIYKNGAIGAIRSVEFDRSAYAYHAMAMAKSVLGATTVLRAKRVRMPGGLARRELQLDANLNATIIEPRDYATGHFTIHGASGTLSDDPARRAGFFIEPVIENGECAGFRAGDFKVMLDDDERALMAGGGAGAGVTARMEAMKRVGFLRLVRRMANAGGAYELMNGLEDMCVDYFLEKFGRYKSGYFTNVRSAGARRLFTTISRIAGR